jgi:subtilase-type serine protease
MTMQRLRGRFCLAFAMSATLAAIARPANADPTYTTLNFGTSGTFLTGIRGNNIVGNYVIPGSGETGGLLYGVSSGTWTPFPLATANGANFPNAIGSSPYGPSFGSQSGVLNVVGSYKTSASPYDLGYLYNGAIPGSGRLTTLAYPGTTDAPTLETIAHSTFGNQAVGNYDTRLATGNAFIYSINTGTYTTNNYPGALSTTAYGVWGDKIAGGYTPPGLGFERGYIYDQTTGAWTTYNHPGAVFTHFEGISSAGRADSYNLVANWGGPDGSVHASVLHIGADGSQTWIELDAGGVVTSANSIYANQAIGIYVGTNGVTNGYVATIPGIYDPIHNLGLLTGDRPNTPALSGADGDDVLNDGIIRTSAANASGIRSGTFGVVTNNGSVTVTGIGSAGVEMNGAYGMLHNIGSITAAPGADAIRTGATAIGTTVINDGTIDGRIAVTPIDAAARFENSGWVGISAPGAGVTHQISGTFVQTAAGTLTLRLAPAASDTLQVTGPALLGGTLAPTVSVGPALPIGQQYQVITAQGGLFERFDALTQPASLAAGGTRIDTLYATNTLNLVVTPLLYGNLALAGVPETPTQSAVGTALDTARPAAGASMSTTQTAVYAPLYTLSGAAVAQALDQLAPTIYGDALMVGRNDWYLVAGAITEQLAERRGGLGGGNAQTAPGPFGTTVWLSGLGQFGNVQSSTAPGYSSTTGGVVVGVDVQPAPMLIAGIAAAFTHQSTSADNAASFSGDAAQFELYGGFQHGILFLDAQGGGSFFQGTASRPLFANGLQAKGDITGAAGGGAAEAGVRLEAGGWRIEPGLSLAGVSLTQGGVTEMQAGPVGLSVAGASIGSLQTLLGVRVGRRIALSETVSVVPSVQIGWL